MITYKKYIFLSLLLIYCSFIAIAQTTDWTLVPSESFEFDDINIPLSNDFVIGYDYWSSCSDPVLAPGGELTAYNSNNVYYYPDPVSGEKCVRFKIQRGVNYPYSSSTDTACQRISRDWLSGMLMTRQDPITHLHDQYRHGKYEIRCKVPIGQGFYPTFWLWNGPSGEIDIFEIMNTDNSDVKLPTFNFHGTSGGCPDVENGGGSSSISGDLSALTGFHIYSAEWTPEHIIYRIDGEIFWQVLKYDTPNPATFPPGDGVGVGPMKIITALAVSANYPLPTSSTPSTAYMDIDYIRYYTQNCESHIFCDNDNNNISYFEGYELQFASPIDIVTDATNAHWDCSGTYDFSCPKTITGTGYIADAENSITLNPGFTAAYGSGFTAEIVPVCNQRTVVHNDTYNAASASHTVEDNNVKINRINDIRIVPSPNNGTFQITITKNDQAIAIKEIKVFDIMGKVIWSTGESLGNTADVDVSSYAPGIYYVRSINVSGEIQMKKFIKE